MFGKTMSGVLSKALALVLAVALAFGLTPAFAFGNQETSPAETPGQEQEQGQPGGSSQSDDGFQLGDSSQSGEGSQLGDNSQPTDSSQPALAVSEPDDDASDGAQASSIPNQPASKSPEEEEGTLSSTSVADPLAAGSYYIRPAASLTRVLDIAGGSSASGANLQLYRSNKTAAQKFTLNIDADGYYTITTSYSLALEVVGGKPSSGANVVQRAANPESAAQRWQIRDDGANGFEIISALSTSENKQTLDLSKSKDADRTNVQIYRANNSAAQRFYFIPVNYTHPGVQSVADGIYTLVPSVNGALALDVPTSSEKNGTQIQTYRANSTVAQMFKVSWDGSAYTIVSLCSGKALSVSGAAIVATTPLVQQDLTGASAQRWQVEVTGTGSSGPLVTLIACESGLALDVKDGSKTSGAKLQVYRPNNTAAQRFELRKVATGAFSGIYSLAPRNAPDKRLDIPKSSFSAGVAAQAWKANSTGAQGFELFDFTGTVAGSGASAGAGYSADAGGAIFFGSYALRAAHSGLYLSEADGGRVIQQPQSGAGTPGAEQLWDVFLDVGGYTLVNAATGRLLSLSGSSIVTTSLTAGAAVVSAATTNAAQHFHIRAAFISLAGNYELVTPAGNRLTVAGKSVVAGANLQLASSNGTWTQKFAFADVGSGYHTIKNTYSQKMADVEKSAQISGARIRQWNSNNTAAQRFRLVPSGDGWYFLQAAVGPYLAAKSDAPGVPLLTTTVKADALRFRFSSTKVWTSGNATLDSKLSNIMDRIGRDGDVTRKCYDYVRGFAYRNGSLYPTGNWVPGFALEMINAGSGNCYRYAALLEMLLKYNGYNCKAIAGRVPLRGGSYGPHGWVELYQNGQTYILDPEVTHDLPQYNWYKITYSQAPITYIK